VKSNVIWPPHRWTVVVMLPRQAVLA